VIAPRAASSTSIITTAPSSSISALAASWASATIAVSVPLRTSRSTSVRSAAAVPPAQPRAAMTMTVSGMAAVMAEPDGEELAAATTRATWFDDTPSGGRGDRSRPSGRMGRRWCGAGATAM
jgi:hypothetical protein